MIIRISRWGQTGPRASQPGFGTLAEAYSGFTFLNGDPGGTPRAGADVVADTVAGIYAAAAGLARSGRRE